MYISTDGRRCRRCSQPLTPGALACSSCHELVHAQDMERLAAQARALESKHRLMDARNVWVSILPLLPPDSNQAVWIAGHAKELEAAAQNSIHTAAAKTWAKRLAPLGPLAVVAAKFKSFFLILLKLKFLFSFASFIALYWAMWGPKFGIGFAVMIFIHEMGHYIDVKRRGLPANMPVFFPGLGAYVRWNAIGVSQETRAAVALAGPLAGLLAAAASALLWYQTRDPLWAALARVGAWLNVLNLTPLWILDGAQAARPLRRMERPLILAACIAFGYATRQYVFFIVAAGALWLVLTSLFERKAETNNTIRLGLNEAVPVTGALPDPDAALQRHESHFIAAYFLAVLTGLAVILWLMPAGSTPVGE